MQQQLTPTNISTTESAYDNFRNQGYVVIPRVLNCEQIAALKALIDKHSTDSSGGGGKSKKKSKGKGDGGGSGGGSSSKHKVIKRLFELEPALCLDVFKNPTVLPLVQRLLGCCGSARGRDDRCLAAHVMHNNAFRIDAGGKGQAPSWHTDDAPTFLTTDGRPLPPTVQMAPLVLTCMYFLNDLDTPGHGGTRVIEGSHRFGQVCSNETAARHPVSYAQCPAGSVLIISSHTWHCGSPVEVGMPSRYVFQTTYGRRLVGHKHGTIMNYHMPESVQKLLQTPEDETLMGFLQGGAYS